MSEHVCVSIDGSVGELEPVERVFGVSLWIENFAKIIQTVQLVPYVQLDEVAFRPWDGEGWCV